MRNNETLNTFSTYCETKHRKQLLILFFFLIRYFLLFSPFFFSLISFGKTWSNAVQLISLFEDWFYWWYFHIDFRIFNLITNLFFYVFFFFFRKRDSMESWNFVKRVYIRMHKWSIVLEKLMSFHLLNSLQTNVVNVCDKRRK